MLFYFKASSSSAQTSSHPVLTKVFRLCFIASFLFGQLVRAAARNPRLRRLHGTPCRAGLSPAARLQGPCMAAVPAGYFMPRKQKNFLAAARVAAWQKHLAYPFYQ